MPFEPWKEETPDAVQQQEEAPPEPVAPEPEPAAPVPVAEAAPEPPPKAPEPAEAKPKPYNEHVPYERFREVLGRQREAEAKLHEAMERLKALEQPKAPEPKVPDYAEDPVEHLRIKQEMAERELATLRERQAAEEQARQVAMQRSQFVNWYQSQAEEFAKQTPDFRDGYQHLMGRMRELFAPAAADPGVIQSAVEQWEAAIVMRAAQEGRNPAQVAYELAQHMGYAPRAPAPTPDEKVAAIAEAKGRSKSLGPSRSAPEEAEAEDDDMGGLKTLFEAQSEMGLRRRR